MDINQQSNNAAEHQTPNPRRFVVISQPRTGSNNLCYGLGCHPHLSVANELFHPANGISFDASIVGDVSPKTNSPPEKSNWHWVANYPMSVFDRTLDDIEKQFHGFKIHLSQLPPDHVLYLIQERGYVPLVLVRKSLFDQAISNFISEASGVWHYNEKNSSSVTELVQIKIENKELFSWIEYYLTQYRKTMQGFRNKNIDVKKIVYEDFYSGPIESKVQQLNKLFAYLNVAQVGTFDKNVRKATYACINKFLGDNKQIMNPTDRKRMLIKNYDKLLKNYNIWYNKRFPNNSSHLDI